MKVLALSVICALVGAAAAGAVAWPGALAVSSISSPVYRTLVPPQTKSFAYSTTQYINALPTTYPAGVHRHLSYQLPQYSSFAPLQSYYTLPGGSAYFSTFPFNNYYPAASPVAPIVGHPTLITPGFPAASPIGIPSYPPQPINGSPSYPTQPAAEAPSSPTEQPAGDSDSAVVDSAEYPNQQQEQTSTTETSTEPQSSSPQYPSLQDFPAIPQIPAFSEIPFPQSPQGSGEEPSFPQFPQGSGETPSFPQFPQDSAPGFPQFPSNPLFPQTPAPTSPPSSFPGADNQDKGLNDEDTISVESA